MDRKYLKCDAIPINDSTHSSDDSDLHLQSQNSSNSILESTTSLSDLTINDGDTSQIPLLQNSYSTLSSVPTNITSSNGQYSSSRSSFQSTSGESWYLSDFDIVDRRWPAVNRELQFNLPPNLAHKQLWIKIAMTLYEKISYWEMIQLCEYKISSWDFCIIHSAHDVDVDIAEEFIKFLELEGLVGTSILRSELGENKLETAEKIISNSEKIFILCSPAFTERGIHQPCYNESLMSKIAKKSGWLRKLIPLTLSQDKLLRYKMEFQGTKIKIPFGMSSVAGLCLNNRSDVIRKLRCKTLSMDVQKMGAQKRLQAKECFEFSLKFRKQKKVKDLRKSLQDLLEHLTTQNPSQDLLVTLCNRLENLVDIQNMETEEDPQIIYMDNCREISMGPSFNFNINHINN